MKSSVFKKGCKRNSSFEKEKENNLSGKAGEEFKKKMTI